MMRNVFESFQFESNIRFCQRVFSISKNKMTMNEYTTNKQYNQNHPELSIITDQKVSSCISVCFTKFI